MLNILFLAIAIILYISNLIIYFKCLIDPNLL